MASLSVGLHDPSPRELATKDADAVSALRPLSFQIRETQEMHKADATVTASRFGNFRSFG